MIGFLPLLITQQQTVRLWEVAVNFQTRYLLYFPLQFVQIRRVFVMD